MYWVTKTHTKMIENHVHISSTDHFKHVGVREKNDRNEINSVDDPLRLIVYSRNLLLYPIYTKPDQAFAKIILASLAMAGRAFRFTLTWQIMHYWQNIPFTFSLTRPSPNFTLNYM